MLTKMERLLLEIWRKAHREGRAEVRLASEKQAHRTRFMMYTLKSKAMKQGEGFEFGFEDRMAMAEVCLSIRGEVLVAENIGASAMAVSIEQQLGGLSKTEEEAEIAESQRRLMEKLMGVKGDDDAQVAKPGQLCVGVSSGSGAREGETGVRNEAERGFGEAPIPGVSVESEAVSAPQAAPEGERAGVQNVTDRVRGYLGVRDMVRGPKGD